MRDGLAEGFFAAIPSGEARACVVAESTQRLTEIVRGLPLSTTSLKVRPLEGKRYEVSVPADQAERLMSAAGALAPAHPQQTLEPA